VAENYNMMIDCMPLVQMPKYTLFLHLKQIQVVKEIKSSKLGAKGYLGPPSLGG
jgi:hypothetical protein